MSARFDFYQRSTKFFRVAFSDLQTSTGSTSGVLSLEVVGAPNAKTRFRGIVFAKPSGPVTPFRITQYSTASTGSTGQTIATPTRISDPNGSTFAGVVRLYTSPPVAGVLLDQGIILNEDISSGDTIDRTLEDVRGFHAPTLESTNQSFAVEVNSSTPVNINGSVLISVEP